MFLLKCLVLFFALSFIDAESYYHPLSQSCPYPRITHSRIRLRIRQGGNFVRFSCVNRYTLIGNKYATCRDGQWDVPLPVCVRSGCRELDEVENSVNMTSHNDAWIVFFCMPRYRLIGSPVLYCDGKNWNSTAPICDEDVADSSQPATKCDFESPDICGWKNDELHDFDWRRWNKKTPSTFLQTGPVYDHTYGVNGTGHYMYIESTGRVTNDTARLISPVYDADLAKNGCFIFYYHMFGSSMGGLRVYQKPDKVSMGDVLSESERKNYILFEKWGEQGNVWFSSVSMLSDVSDDFQIVIEGIRGKSFMSDLAFDDVSIQHGENCTKAIETAVTPPVYIDTCVGRCDLYRENPTHGACSCSLVCAVHDNCCADFFDICEFRSNVTLPDDDESTTLPAGSQTDKPVSTTNMTTPTTATSSTSTSISTTSNHTSPTSLTTPSFTATTTTTTKSTTNRLPSTSTTVRPTTTYVTTADKIPYTTTTPLPTTTQTSPKTTVSVSTTPKNTRPVIPVTTTEATTVTVETTSVIVVQTTRHQDTSTGKTPGKDNKTDVDEKKSEGMSGVTITIIVILVSLACCGLIWVVFMQTRSSRGIMTITLLRGESTNDPEVRYLKSDVDD